MFQNIKHHFYQYFDVGKHQDFRTPQQLEREKYLFYTPKIPILFQRWMMIIPVLLVQCCIGSFYSSSIFNKYMDTHVWKNIGSNAKMFLFVVLFYGTGTLLFGPYIARNGVRRSVLRQWILTPLGWLLAFVASKYELLPLLYLGYGICHGLGCSLAYLSTTSALQHFFPELKGFISGLAVMGAGVGSVIFTTIGRYLMNPPYNYEPANVQLVYAIISFIVIGLCLPILRNPPPNYNPEPFQLPLPEDKSIKASIIRLFYRFARTKPTSSEIHQDNSISKSSSSNIKPKYSLSRDYNYTFKMALKEQEFILTALLVIGQCITGAVFLSSASDMVQNIYGKDSSYASLVTSWLNLVNFVGRFAYGFVTDKIGRKGYWLFSSFAQCIALITMTQVINAGPDGFTLWLICFLFIGSLYGGTFGVLAAFVSDLFGPKISSAVHGFNISMWALSTVIGVPIFTSVTSYYSRTVDTISIGPINNITNILSNSTIITPSVLHAYTKVPTAEAYIINASWLTIFPLSSFIITLFLNVRTEDRILRKTLQYEGRGKPFSNEGNANTGIVDLHYGCGSAMIRLPCEYLCTCTCHILKPSEQEYEYNRIHAREIIQQILSESYAGMSKERASMEGMEEKVEKVTDGEEKNGKKGSMRSMTEIPEIKINVKEEEKEDAENVWKIKGSTHEHSNVT